MFGPGLIVLRDESSKSAGHQEMMKMFKVPVGVSVVEEEEIKEMFAQKKKSWFSR